MGDIEYLLSYAQSNTLQQFFQQVIAKMGILKYIMRQPDKGWHMQVLTSFFDFLKDESRKKPDIKLAGFMAIIKLMKEHQIRLSLNQVIFSEKGVNFLTAHGSKGLEFEHVFLMGCSKKIWDDKGRNYGYSFPDTLTQASDDETAEKEESRRLFYVALTRAKQCLSISYSGKDKNGKDQEASQFVGEILANTHLTVQHPKVDEGAMLEFLATQFSEVDKPKVELLDKDYIDQLLQNYTLSVTHLSNYLDCPLRFYFQCLIRVPAGKSPSATFWPCSALGFEQGVQEAERKMAMSSRSLMNFMNEFRWFMHRNRDSFTRDEFKLRLDYGEKNTAALL